MKKILIIEDEKSIRMLLEDDFSLAGYEVMGTSNGQTGLEMAMRQDIDLILLDILLPELSGIEICKILRKNDVDTPIIMLTAKSQEIDKILGLEIGADDYVTKPFSPRELRARVKALLRRSASGSNASKHAVYRFGEIHVDFKKYQLSKDGRDIRLTALEFALLRFFLENTSRVLTRDEILNAVWPGEVRVEPRTVDRHVANLRKKIEDDPALPRWIIGMRSVGYKFVLA